MTVGALVLAVVLLVTVATLLLRRQLREKYAVVWLVIGIATLLLGIFPQLLVWLTATLGFQVPANLLFTLAIVLLLAVALHLSWELSHSEEEVRRLAEESGIAREELTQIRARIARLEQGRGGSTEESP